jgi:DNA-binding GntR family transcriptional regulator
VPDYSDPTPARKQIAADLRGQIRAGEYAPGGRIPSNKELAKRYGVAPETIRASLEELRAEGLLATQSTRGTFVVEELPGADPDLKALAEQVADLAERAQGYEDLRAKVNLMEAVVMTLCKRQGVEYPRGGARNDSTERAPRRRQAGQ